MLGFEVQLNGKHLCDAGVPAGVDQPAAGDLVVVRGRLRGRRTKAERQTRHDRQHGHHAGHAQTQHGKGGILARS